MTFFGVLFQIYNHYAIESYLFIKIKLFTNARLNWFLILINIIIPKPINEQSPSLILKEREDISVSVEGGKGSNVWNYGHHILIFV